MALNKGLNTLCDKPVIKL